MKKRIAVCAYTTNAAETIRANEIASAIARLHDDVSIIFFTYRGQSPNGQKRKIDYEHIIQDFDVRYFGGEDIVLDDDMWRAFRVAELNREGIFPPPYDIEAAKYLRAVIDTIKKFQPDIIVYGLFPEVAIAAAIQGWKSVSFSAIERFTYMDWLSRNSEALSKMGLNNRSMHKNPWAVIKNAAIECGLKLKNPNDLISTIAPNHTALCDFDSFYDKEKIDGEVTIVGPIISSITESSSAIVNEIKGFLKDDENNSHASSRIKVKVLLSTGSTGSEGTFVESLRALCNAQGAFRSVVMVPACLQDSCLINEIISSAMSNKDILIIKDFVPVRPLLSYVDVLICHGGQLSVQCGLAAGLPIVGVPSQADQCFNLQNLEECNAGVCILPVDWKEEHIREVILSVGSGSSYKTGALKLQREFLQNTSGAEKVATIVWNTLTC